MFRISSDSVFLMKLNYTKKLHFYFTEGAILNRELRLLFHRNGPVSMHWCMRSKMKWMMDNSIDDTDLCC